MITVLTLITYIFSCVQSWELWVESMEATGLYDSDAVDADETFESDPYIRFYSQAFGEPYQVEYDYDHIFSDRLDPKWTHTHSYGDKDWQYIAFCIYDYDTDKVDDWLGCTQWIDVSNIPQCGANQQYIVPLDKQGSFTFSLRTQPVSIYIFIYSTSLLFIYPYLNI